VVSSDVTTCPNVRTCNYTRTNRNWAIVLTQDKHQPEKIAPRQLQPSKHITIDK